MLLLVLHLLLFAGPRPNEACCPDCCGGSSSPHCVVDLRRGSGSFLLCSPYAPILSLLSPLSHGYGGTYVPCSAQGVIEIDAKHLMSSHGYAADVTIKLDFFFDKHVRGYAFHVADSAYNDGYGSLTNYTHYDAEMSGVYRDVRLYTNSYHGYESYSGKKCNKECFADRDLIANRLTVWIRDRHVEYDNHRGVSRCFDSSYLFRIKPKQHKTYGYGHDQKHHDDKDGKIYVGMNRVVGDVHGVGKGLCKVAVTFLKCGGKPKFSSYMQDPYHQTSQSTGHKLNLDPATLGADDTPKLDLGFNHRHASNLDVEHESFDDLSFPVQAREHTREKEAPRKEVTITRDISDKATQDAPEMDVPFPARAPKQDDVGIRKLSERRPFDDKINLDLNF